MLQKVLEKTGEMVGRYNRGCRQGTYVTVFIKKRFPRTALHPFLSQESGTRRQNLPVEHHENREQYLLGVTFDAEKLDFKLVTFSKILLKW